MKPSISNSAADEDDEFDDLFSFGVANQPPSPSRSPAPATTASEVTSETATQGSSNNARSSSESSSSSSSESYHKVSTPSPPPSTAPTAPTTVTSKVSTTKNDENEDDDIFSDFDLNLDTVQLHTANRNNRSNHNHDSDKRGVSSAGSNNKEEDFNGMDEGTREFLDFLDSDTTKNKDATSSSAAAIAGATSITTTATTSTTTTTTSTGGKSSSVIDMDDILGTASDTSSPVKGVDTTKTSIANDILAGLENDSDDDNDDDVVNKEHANKNDDFQNDDVLVEQPIQDGNNHDSMNVITMEDNDDNNGLDDITGFVTVHSNSQEEPTSFTSTTTTKDKKQQVPSNKKESGTSTSSTSSTATVIQPTIVQLPSKTRQSSLPTLPKKSPSRSNSMNRQKSKSSIQKDSILASISDMEKKHQQDTMKQMDVDGIAIDNINISKSFSIDDDEDNDDVEEYEEEVKKVLSFESLLDALQSPESTIEHIRPFIYNNKRNHLHHHQPNQQIQLPSNSITSISKNDRPYLWSKVICSKVLSDVQTSSLVDTFLDWDKDEFDYAKFVNKEKTYDLDFTFCPNNDDDFFDDEEDYEEGTFDNKNNGGEGEGGDVKMSFMDKLLNEVNILSLRVVECTSDTNENVTMRGSFQLDDDGAYEGDEHDQSGQGSLLLKAKRDLCSLLVFYYRSTSNLSSKKVKSFASILKKDVKKEVKQSDITTAATTSNSSEKDSNDTDEGISTPENETKENGKEEESTTKDSGSDNADEDEDDFERVAVENKEEKKYNPIEKVATDAPKVDWKPLLGPIAATLLSAGVPVEVASVMLSRIISKLPLFSLKKSEQHSAVKSLHQQLYFLVCYHLPLLVLHLDRYAPGWHWPSRADDESKRDDISVTERGRNLEAHGTIPVTWFASLLAGEGVSQTLDQPKLLPLWDILLTSDDQSLKFFLALATLEKHSDSLMMLRGQDLIDELSAVMSLKSLLKVEDESFLGNHSSDISKDEEFVLNWYQDARLLQEATPISVTQDLRKTEDIAVNHILTMRSKIAMEKMTARLEAEAEAHRKAVEEENARKTEARMHQYYKNRLEKFYERNCPEKKSSVDTILATYKDRYMLLDDKLQKKYGSGFLPMIAVFNPKITNKTNSFVSTIGQGIETRKKNIIAKRAKERAEKLDENMMGPGAHQVVAKVSASEILPFVCGGTKNTSSRGPIKFYLVDSRPNETIQVQGAFPTSIRLSPEDLMDPDKIQEKVDMFESLRGAIHFCIMGEGFSSFPTLYGHPLSEVEEKLLDNDKARTNMCALFFIKKGFPFISVLDGGFAAAHAWLARDCDYLTLNKVLVDYDDKCSLFADLERSYQLQKEFSNASTRRKTTLALQKLIDNSMTRLTILENRIEEFAERPRGQNDSQKPKSDADEPTESSTSKEDGIKQAFGNKNMKIPPIRLFGSGKHSNEKSKAVETTDADAGGDEKETLKNEKEKNEERRKANVDAMKSGFNKAFTGLKKIRVNKTGKDNVDNASGDGNSTDLKGDASLSGNNKQINTKQNQGFNFGRLNFGNKKNNNMFNRKAPQKQEKSDDDLEKEIEASLTRPDESNSVKPKGGLQTKEKNNEKKNPFANRQFVNPLNKFGSMNRKNKAATTILREEESLFFDEESLGDTEDSLSFQTNDTSTSSD